MRTATRIKVDEEVRDDWLQTIEALADQIAVWVRQEPGWAFEEAGAEEIEEAPLGRYAVTIWSILTPEGEVRLEPMARNYPGRGFFELYAWPTLRRVHLLSGGDGGWRVRIDAGFDLRQPWDREHFITLVRDLIGARDLTDAA